MLILITYDVNTTDADGRRQPRNVAKKCGEPSRRDFDGQLPHLMEVNPC